MNPVRLVDIIYKHLKAFYGYDKSFFIFFISRNLAKVVDIS